ncbi:MAG: hypothetical protein ACKVQS_12920 [Fimbriimonadaceae bacterium]
MLATLTAFAFPQLSALASVPSFKTIKPNLLIIEYRQSSLDSALDSRYIKNFEILYGFNPNIELSFDNNLDGNSRFGAKYSFLIHKEQKIRFGIGAQDIFDDSELYLGLGKDFPGYELHAGYVDKAKGQAVFGYRRKIGDNLRLSVDHSTGPAGKTAARFDITLNKNWYIDARVFFPNNDSAPRTHRFGISYQTMVNQK